MSPQMQSLKAKYGVTTQRELLRLIAAEYSRETGETFTQADAALILDGMLEAEYQRIEGGGLRVAYGEEISDLAAREIVFGEDHTDDLRTYRRRAAELDQLAAEDAAYSTDAAYERFLENVGANETLAYGF